MRGIEASLAIFGLLSVAPLGSAHRQSQQQSAEAAIQQAIDQTVGYFRTQQGSKFVGQYAAGLTACKDGAWITDSKAFLADFGQAVSRLRVHAFTWTHRQVYVLAPDAAVFAGEFKETLSFEGSEQPTDFHGTWTLLLKRINGAWKIVHEHTSHVNS